MPASLRSENCSPSARNAVRVPFGISVRLRRNPQQEFASLVKNARPVIRLVGLLHDLTHAPYGHTIEDEIQLVACKHDEPGRQSDAFYRLICQYLGWLAVEAGVRPSGPRGSGNGHPLEALELPSSLWRYMEAPTSDPPTDLVAIATMAGTLLEDPSASALAAWRSTPDDIARLLAQLCCAMRALLYLDVLHADRVTVENCPKKEQYPFEVLIVETLKRSGKGHLISEFEFIPHRDAYMLDIIGNTVCADLLDYAQRDAHFSGIKLGYDASRIAENFTLVSWDLRRAEAETSRPGESLEGPIDPFPGKSIRTAISLFSHKLRADVPSELINLLNVRYYLYERVLFHPTKCAAGAMLGTALQLMGWRPLRTGEAVAEYELPPDFRNVGDAVFLHDLTGALHIALGALKSFASKPDGKFQYETAPYTDGDGQARVSRLVLERWDGLSREVAEKSVGAALELLNRVMARRFFRPIFRNLPNSRNTVLRMDSGQLADTFKNPITRFDAERAIESRAGLRPGTVVIHCPRRITAQKIAHVLLVFPKEDGKGEEIQKLRAIGDLDRDVFGAHQEAILAVENMYKSMWRLVVYVAPELLADYPKISADAGKVVFDTMDKGGLYPEEAGWGNDRFLERELAQKYGSYVSRRESERKEGRQPGVVANPLQQVGLLTTESDAQSGDVHELRNHFLVICRAYMRTRKGSL